MTEFQAANALLKAAQHDNVIDCTLPAIRALQWGTASIYRGLMDAVTQQAKDTLVESPWLGKQASWQLPQTRRYQQSRSPQIGAIVQPLPGIPWMVELARYPVPYGSVGILKGFDQYLAQNGTVFTESDNWGNPFPPVSVRWFFRLSQVHRVGAPWINVSGASAIVDYLPGKAYGDLTDTNGLWFSAHSSSSCNIHLPIPGGEVLRLVAIVVAAGEAVHIAARMVGTTQLELNDEAQTMLRTTW